MVLSSNWGLCLCWTLQLVQVNKQCVSENWVWIQNSKGSKGGVLYPCLYSAVGITTVFNSLHPSRKNTASFAWGYSLVFSLNCCMNCLDWYILLTKRMTKNLLKPKLLFVWGKWWHGDLCCYWADTLQYVTLLVLKAWLNLNQKRFYMNHRRS